MKSLWQIRSELERNFPFSDFSDHVNDRLAKAGTRLSVEQDEFLIKQGTKSVQFYIILKGRFAVYYNEKKINELGPGNMFGEYATLDHTARNATVKSMEESIVLQIRQCKN